MENELEKYDLFLKFSRNELSSDELKAFEQQLATDNAFADSFKEYQMTDEILITHELMEVENILNSFDYTLPKKSKINQWFFIGLGGILVLTIPFVWNWNQQKITKNTISLEEKTTKNTPSSIQKTPEIVEIPSKIEEKKEIIEHHKQPTNNIFSVVQSTEIPKKTAENPSKIDTNKIILNTEPSIQKEKRDSVFTNKKIEKTTLVKEEITPKKEELKQEIPTTYYIIPSQEITWKIPFDEGILSIIDKKGTLIKEIVLEKGIENEWDGMTSNGFISNGLYLFYIQKNTGDLLLKGKLIVEP